MTGGQRPSSYHAPGAGDLANTPIHMMVYSHPGEGKTVLWGSGGAQVCFLTSDPEGTISAEGLGHKFHSIDVTDYEELQEAYEWLKGSKEPKQLGIKWVTWDSLTLFQDRVLIDDVMVDAVADNPKQDEFVPSRREYLINMNKIGRYVRQFCSTDYNFGVSCHVMTTTESGGDGTLFMPQIQGKNMPSKIAGYMNVVGYLSKATVDRPTGKGKETTKVAVQQMQFQRAGRVYAKDRWSCLGATMDSPTLPKIEALIEAKRAAMRLANETGGGAKPAPSAPPVRRRVPTTTK